MCRMRIVVATFQAEYTGRLSTILPEATRVILIKNDGSLIIHSEGNAHKPLNWFNPPSNIIEEENEWTVTNKKGEKLVLSFSKIHSDTIVELGEEPGLSKEGVETQVQAYLADHTQLFGKTVELITREYRTPIGPVDLLCVETNPKTGEKEYIAVEVKRRGGMNGVEQLSRYLEFLRQDPTLQPIRGIYAALSITPQAATLAENRNIECFIVEKKALSYHSPTLVEEKPVKKEKIEADLLFENLDTEEDKEV